MRHLKRFVIFILMVFILPSAASAAWWALKDRPGSWREANWNSSGILAERNKNGEPAIYIMAARTGGWKGALSVHTWIVTKRADGSFDRYDKVGWGNPVRKNAYPVDGRWYSNDPYIVTEIRGSVAARLIPDVEQAIAAYPWSRRGDYTIWPGPNSNSFVAHVIDKVPELGAAMPPNAVGRDFRPGFFTIDHSPGWSDIHVSAGGLAGFAFGSKSGLELHFMGLVAGFDFAKPAFKIPGFGRLDLN